MRSLMFIAGILAASPTLAEIRHDEGIGFYVGVDTRATNVGGTFDGLANPNRARLTFLLEHGDHYHSIGAYSHMGTAAMPVVTDTNTNNQIPETFSNLPPNSLTPGSGLYAGKLRSTAGSGEYSYLGIASTHSLMGLPEDAPESVLYRSSGGRWTGSLSGIEVGLQLISYTVGLRVGTETDTDVFDSGDIYSLGQGDAIEFKPVFWVNSGAASGTYSAGFRLVNLTDGSEIMDSGRFYLNFAPVPEPGTYALMGVGALLIGFAVRRRV